MKIEHKEINFEDDRGTITDIFVKNPKDHCTIIFTKKGAIRGNHYHKQSTQNDFVVSGRLRVVTQVMGETEVHETEIGPNDLATYAPSEAHAFQALEDTIFLTFVDGVRGGDDYENDTHRLETPLITP